MKGVKKKAAFECVSVSGEDYTHAHTHMCLTTAHISDGVDDGCASIRFHEDKQSSWS